MICYRRDELGPRSCADLLERMGDYDISDEDLDRLHEISWNIYEEEQEVREWEQQCEKQREEEEAREDQEQREIEAFGHVLAKFYEGMPYSEYLDTWEWRRNRRYALLTYGKQCQICAAQSPLQIHHRTYEHLYHEFDHMEDLAVLCEKCHKLHHDGEIDANMLAPRKKKPDWGVS